MAWIDLDRLLKGISIVEVAQRLGRESKKEGDRNLILCPFHSETNPSVVLYPGDGARPPHFHCFACGEHGDIISLVKQINNTDFKEAVQWLATSFGVSLQTNQQHSKGKDRLESRTSAMETAAGIYRTENSATDLERWALARHIDKSTLKESGLIYAKAHTLANSVSKLSFNESRAIGAELEEAFLLRRIQPKDAEKANSSHLPLEVFYTDAFSGDRIIIPLQDEKGRLVGLVARTAKNDVDPLTPKYLNAKGTEKGKVLYLANKTFREIVAKEKTGIKDHHLYVTEGFFDALRLDSLGIPAVATMGAQLSEQQVQLFSVLLNSLPQDNSLTVHLFLDRDSAGIRGLVSSSQRLLSKNSSFDVKVTLLTASSLETVPGADVGGKDPDECFRDATDHEAVLGCIEKSSYPPALAFLIYEFGGTMEEVLVDERWINAPRSRRYRALRQTAKALRKLAGTQAELRRLISGQNSDESHPALACQTELLSFIEQGETADRPLSTLFIEDHDAQLNHARALAYMGSRRGELPCAEPEWERLDVAATAFNVLLKERLLGGLREAIDPFDAVHVPRKFGGNEYRLKAMPKPADLVVQQYLLNELLTERLDALCFDGQSFSARVPAVRYYSEEGRAITTGLRDDSVAGGFVVDDSEVLSFAYQIDMEVLEGRKPPSDQGMYRPYMDSWRDFMRALKLQAEEIGVVHSLRLDVKRYYDNLQRFVVRDSILPHIQAAIDDLGSDANSFGPLLPHPAVMASDERAANVVDAICDLLFGYPYERPEDGTRVQAVADMGIPQGPVLSAWIGNVALFPLDQEARRLMHQHNASGRKLGYARYVDDLVLLADSADLLAEMRRAIESKARALGLSLVAKADDLPVLPAKAFFEQLNEGRAFAASGPDWEPPLVGDGELGWGLWAEATEIDRQSALQIFRNACLFRDSQAGISQAVSTAFKASDLRPSEFAKGARWLWFAVVTDAVKHDLQLDAGAAWNSYWQLWRLCCEGSGWTLHPEKKAWEDPYLFALEGLEKLLDASASEQYGLTSEERLHKDKCLLMLANIALESEFRRLALHLLPGNRLAHQLKRRFELLAWKASRAVPTKARADSATAARATPFVGGSPFVWMDQAVQALMNFVETETEQLDPLDKLKLPAKHITWTAYPQSLAIATALLPREDAGETLAAFEPKTRSIALQTIAAVVQRRQLWTILAKRGHLLGDKHNNLLLLPPLPGIEQDRLLACESTSTNGIAEVDSLVVIELQITNAEKSTLMPKFLGATDDSKNVRELIVNWEDLSTSDAGVLKCSKGVLTDPQSLQLFTIAPSLDQVATQVSPRQAAELFLQLFTIWKKQYSRQEKKEFVPAWPFVASTGTDFSRRVFLLCEPVDTKKLAHRAFVRDVGRSLRSIIVPMDGAYLWRIGVTVSDLFGLQDDISKLADHEAQLPLTEAALKDPARYVLRNQLRKLRGAYANSKTLTKLDQDSGLPTAVLRSLKILQEFPQDSESFDSKLFCLLASEAETAAMRIRYEGSTSKDHPKLKSTLHQIANRVFTKLPVSVGESLATSSTLRVGLRRDLLAISALSRRVWGLRPSGFTNEAAVALVTSLVLSACVTAFRGLVVSLRALKRFDLPITLAFPAEDWPQWSPDMQAGGEQSILLALRTEDWQRLGGASALEWLGVLVGQLEPNLRTPDWKEVSGDLKAVAKKLVAFHCATISETDCSWPFEDLSLSAMQIIDISLVETVCNIALAVDGLCGIAVRNVVAHHYGYSPQGKRFTDSEGHIWQVTPSQISQFPHGPCRIEEATRDDGVLKIWSEAYELKSRKLLSVHVLGDSFAKIALSDQDILLPSATADEPGSAADPRIATIAADQFATEHSGLDDSQDVIAAIEQERLATPASTVGLGSPIDLPPDAEEAPLSGAQNLNHRQRAQGSPEAAGAKRPVRPPFRETQNGQWTARGRQKSDGHVRVALLQWRLDETYSHPITEVGLSAFPLGEAEVTRKAALLLASLDDSNDYGLLNQAIEKRGLEHLWTKSTSLPSWAEHRRQRFLREAIQACERFKVDLLVLPEYSVRPETIKWLRDELRKKGVAVLAGTQRQFDSAPTELLSAKMSLLWPYPNSAADALATALRADDEVAKADLISKGVVLEWDRSKKYRAVAMEEYINPGVKTLQPLFQPGEINAWFARNRIALPNRELNQLLTEVPMPLKFCQELICSELFMLTSPANLQPLAADYENQLRRFGVGGSGFGWNRVVEDLEVLSKSLAIGYGGLSGPRRSILVVPAATSRTADYWIAGQASLLASGTTTVFCNGVLKKAFNGGSCFMGRESWKNGTNTAGMISSATPYHGWSKGIYYNNPKDPLSECDQAMVIADIDPFNMLEGKPRPQMLPVPLQLVAYLPIVETLDPARNSLPMLESLLGKKLTDIAALPSNLIDFLTPGVEVELPPDVLTITEGLAQAIPSGNVDTQVARLQELAKYFSDHDSMPSGAEAKSASVASIASKQIDCLRLIYFLKLGLKTKTPQDIQKITDGLTLAIHSGNVDAQVAQLQKLAKHFSDRDSMRSRAEAYGRDRSQQPKSDPAPALYDWLEVDLTLGESEEIPKVKVPSWVTQVK